MNTNYDNELLEKLKNEIDKGLIIVHETTDQFVKDINANYPMGFSGIDWDKKKPLVFINFNSPTVLSDKINSEFSNIFTYFPEVLNEKAIYIGDNLTELGYEIWIKDFIQFKELFLSIPQHIYLWFPTIQKCINITFEDELFFG